MISGVHAKRQSLLPRVSRVSTETVVGIACAAEPPAIGRRLSRWSGVVELEVDGALEIHGPSLVELVEDERK